MSPSTSHVFSFSLHLQALQSGHLDSLSLTPVAELNTWQKIFLLLLFSSPENGRWSQIVDGITSSSSYDKQQNTGALPRELNKIKQRRPIQMFSILLHQFYGLPFFTRIILSTVQLGYCHIFPLSSNNNKQPAQILFPPMHKPETTVTLSARRAKRQPAECNHKYPTRQTLTDYWCAINRSLEIPHQATSSGN